MSQNYAEFNNKPNRRANVNRNFKALPGNFVIREMSGLTMRKYNLGDFSKTIFYNFIELAKYPELKHNIQEINRILKAPNTIAFFVYNGHKMLGYIIGEVMRLNDGRLVLYISYLYVATKYRDNGFGSTLLKQMINKAHKLHVDAVVLTCDTADEKVLDFYTMKGFMYDPYLRNYNRHDVLSLTLA